MAVLELERDEARGAAEADRAHETGGRSWDDLVLALDDGPPDLPPVGDWDGSGDDEGDGGRRSWPRRLLAVIGILVLLSMIVSPIAADLLAGHVAR